jgi:predicted transcriptional regulator
MMAEGVLELENRRKIFELCSKFPGLHFRELQRRLAIPLGTLRYQLDVLEKYEILIAKEEGGYKRYYPIGKIGVKGEIILSYLRQEIPRGIVLFLLIHPNSSHKDILEHFDLAPSTLSYHLDKLIEGQILKRDRSGKESRYEVIDKEEVAKVLITYKHSFLDALVDKFVEFWLDKN